MQTTNPNGESKHRARIAEKLARDAGTTVYKAKQAIKLCLPGGQSNISGKNESGH